VIATLYLNGVLYDGSFPVNAPQHFLDCLFCTDNDYCVVVIHIVMLIL